MNGTLLALGTVAAVAVAGVVRRRGSGSAAKGTLTYTASIEDQPDGWDVVASSMDEAVEDVLLSIWANEAEPAGTRFTVREVEDGVLVNWRYGVVK